MHRNEAAHTPDDADREPGQPGHKASLDAARDAAPRRAESCIGIVSAPCLQEEGHQSTAAMVDCYGREGIAWDDRLNAAYKKALKSGDGGDVAEGFRNVQRTWIAFRDAACAQPWTVYKGTMANPMGAQCRMDLTARQAIWLEQWAR